MPELHEASFYKKLQGSTVRCELCRRYCAIAADTVGKCGVRKNVSGKLCSLVYGKTLTMEIDPIEKKPLFHFKPGSECMGISTYGCNFSCLHCFAPQTRVLTGEGVKRMDELFNAGQPFDEKGDVSIRRFNSPSVVTHTAEFSEAIHGFKHFYDGNLFEIKPFYLPAFRCTPNHKIFVGTGEGNHLTKTAAELREGDLLLVPREYSSKPREVIDLAEFFKHHTVLFRKNAWKCGLKKAEEIFSLYSTGATSRELGKRFDMHPVYVRHLISKIRRYGFPHLFEHRGGIEIKGGKVRFKFSKSMVPRFIKVNADFARLLGYYCAEGSVGSMKNRPTSYFLSFSFGKHEAEHVGEIQKLISRVFGVASQITAMRTTLQVMVGNSIVALLFKSLAGSGAKNKFVPKEMLSANKKIIKAFLSAYVAGDGWIGSKIISMDTVSENLAFGLCALILKIGEVPRFYIWQPPQKKKIGGRTVSQSTLYYVKVAVSNPKKFLQETDYHEAESQNKKCIEKDNHFLIPISQIKRHHYKGPVYNLEIKEQHSYLANFTAVANCQNWSTSQQRTEAVLAAVPETMPEQIVEDTLNANVAGIAYTYTEPTIFAEYALDTMKIARKKGLYNVWVSNGYMTEQCVDAVAPYMDAINIDLKGDAQFYKGICGDARIEFVKENIKLFHKKKVHVEVTNLIVPGYNDTAAQYKEVAEFIHAIDADMPLHFTRFFPQYKMQHLPPTDLEKLRQAKEIAEKAGLNYVYVGNVPEEENTYCKKCRQLLVKRRYMAAQVVGLKGKKCSKCGAENNFII